MDISTGRVRVLTRIWIYSVCFLSSFINISGFLEFSYSLSHYTGNLVDVVIGLFNEIRLSTILVFCGLFTCFMLGATLAAFVNKEKDFALQSRYGEVQLSIGIIILFIYFIIPDKWIYIFVFSAILGVQNGLIRTYNGLGFRTTHITGTLSDLGSFIGYYLAGDKTAGWKIIFETCLLISFTLGTAFGVIIYLWLQSKIFIIAGALYILSGIIYFILRYIYSRIID